MRRRKARRGEGWATIKKVLTYEGNKCWLWPFTLDKSGYGQIGGRPKSVRLLCRTVKTNRLVCFLAHGAPPGEGYHAAHSCGNQACVNKRHLYWATPKENENDKIKHGRSNRGRRLGLPKLTDDDIITIRSIQGARLQDIAREYHIDVGRVCQIRRMIAWSWLRKYHIPGWKPPGKWERL